MRNHIPVVLFALAVFTAAFPSRSHAAKDGSPVSLLPPPAVDLTGNIFSGAGRTGGGLRSVGVRFERNDLLLIGVALSRSLQRGHSWHQAAASIGGRLPLLDTDLTDAFSIAFSLLARARGDIMANPPDHVESRWWGAAGEAGINIALDFTPLGRLRLTSTTSRGVLDARWYLRGGLAAVIGVDEPDENEEPRQPTQFIFGVAGETQAAGPSSHAPSTVFATLGVQHD